MAALPWGCTSPGMYVSWPQSLRSTCTPLAHYDLPRMRLQPQQLGPFLNTSYQGLPVLLQLTQSWLRMGFLSSVVSISVHGGCIQLPWAHVGVHGLLPHHALLQPPPLKACRSYWYKP